MKTKLFVCSVENNNLKHIADCTTWERQCLLNSISGKGIAFSDIPRGVYDLIRQVSNKDTQNYELWMFNTVDHVTEQYLWEVAEDNMEDFLSQIKESGNIIYSKT